MKKISAVDLFCGAGGTSTGLVRAVKRLGFNLELLAINHWQRAIDTHSANHPWARHMCADLSSVDPSKVVPAGYLNILVASPECTHHSVARGGKPCSDQSRASAWHVLHWAERLQIDNILIENVQEFQSWGPLTKIGRPNKRRKGETFRAFLTALGSLGYRVDYRVLNAADYGDATTRKRLFVQAVKTGRPVWPDPTHSGAWRPARDVIDWDLKGESIFKRKRPLSPRTMARIEAGLKKFCGEPFVTILRGFGNGADGYVQSVDDPVPTVSAGGTHVALCEPFILGQHSGGAPRGVSQPVPTICTQSRGIALVQPFIVPMEHSGSQKLRTTEEPLPTITTAKGGAFGLCQPFVVQVAHAGGDRVKSVEEPLPTIPAGHRGELAVVEPFIVNMKGQSKAHSIDAPVPTVTAHAPHVYLCEPFLTKYYGSATSAQSVDDPLDTITSKDRIALVEPQQTQYGIDIYFRMLQPSELAAAMGFDEYAFSGNKTEQVRQIGNAVPVHLAEQLCLAMLSA